MENDIHTYQPIFQKEGDLDPKLNLFLVVRMMSKNTPNVC